METDEFFEQKFCDRCNNKLVARTMSWFNEEVICGDCSVWEEEIIKSRPEPRSDLEGRGSVPEVDFEIKWGTKPDLDRLS